MARVWPVGLLIVCNIVACSAKVINADVGASHASKLFAGMSQAFQWMSDWLVPEKPPRPPRRVQLALVGLGRTGSTSFSAALKELGYAPVHDDEAMEVADIYKAMIPGTMSLDQINVALGERGFDAPMVSVHKYVEWAATAQSFFVTTCILTYLRGAPVSMEDPGHGTRAASLREGEHPPPQRKISESTMGHARCLFLVYSSAAALLVWSMHGAQEVAIVLAQSFVAVLWAGLVLGVSWMEAWVKFRAPLLPRHVAFDVGRHVFRGLNAMEMPLAAALLAMALMRRSDWGIPGVLAAALVLQVLCLTPQLERSAFFIIVEAFDVADPTASPEQLALAQELKARIAGATPPPKWLHIVYVAIEGVKILGLLGYSWAMCSAHVLSG